MPVSRVFTTDISRNKEIHLKAFIEDDSKNFGSSSIWFSTLKTARKVLEKLKYSVSLYKARSRFSIPTEEYLIFQTVWPTDSSATHIRGLWENLVCRNHAGSYSYRGGGLRKQKSRRQRQKPAQLRCFAIRRGLCRCPAMNRFARS